MLYRYRPIASEGQKVVTAAVMAAMEKIAISEGDASGGEYMERAARGIFSVVTEYLQKSGLAHHLILLCGKGNKSGDAYSVGTLLVEAGHEVSALQITDLEQSSLLCQEHAEAFESAGGHIFPEKKIDLFEIPEGAVIIDGLFGTGFRGKIEGKMADLIERINNSDHAVISIDIPSGVCGDTGIVEGPAIFADETISLGLLKVGHFYNQGYDHVGQITTVNFGMSQKYIDAIEPFAYLVNHEIIDRNFPRHKRTANKYSVGQTAIFGGSEKYPGAAILAAHGALRSGAGLVRLYHFPGVEKLLTAMAPEVIRNPFSLTTLEEEAPRIKAMLIGPGLGRDQNVPELLEQVYRIGDYPLVIDGDALFFFKGINRKAVLTPHHGELCRLLKVDSGLDDMGLLERAQTFADQNRITLVCKGAPTTVISHNQPKIIIPYGNNGMASGGMGDVLGGVIAALLAQGMEPREGAILGVTLHALAGDKAAQNISSGSMTASDLISFLPEVFRSST